MYSWPCSVCSVYERDCSHRALQCSGLGRRHQGAVQKVNMESQEKGLLIMKLLIKMSAVWRTFKLLNVETHDIKTFYHQGLELPDPIQENSVSTGHLPVKQLGVAAKFSGMWDCLGPVTRMAECRVSSVLTRLPWDNITQLISHCERQVGWTGDCKGGK